MEKKEFDEQWREAKREAEKAQKSAEIEQENDLIRRCIAAEGEQSFYRWWDDDGQVPPAGTRRQRIELLESRLAGGTWNQYSGRKIRW